MPVDVENLVKDKRIVAWAVWCVSLDEPLRLIRFEGEGNSNGGNLPTDGFQCAKTRMADGTYDFIGGVGCLLFWPTSLGLVVTDTLEANPHEDGRYPCARYIRPRCTVHALLEQAQIEQEKWL